jgi:hypothetical protein
MDLVALRLASSGYGGGDPAKVRAMQVGDVLAAVQYEIFKSEYEKVYVELNRKS